MSSFGLPSARAEASRRNGAKSRGPKTPEGKARSAQNALKHGFRAQAHIVLPGEDAAAFAALEAALAVELAPEGALQRVLVDRIARATWRLDRADRLEVEVFARQSYGDAGLGLALIRDGNGTRSIDTLMRYRGAAMAELMRSLRTLKALQAEARACAAAGVEVLASAPPPPAVASASACATNPDEPKSRANACELGELGESDQRGQTCERASPAPRRGDPSLGLSLPWPLPAPDRPARHARPIEPEFQQPCGSRPATP
jgi:hypothetical protein